MTRSALNVNSEAAPENETSIFGIHSSVAIVFVETAFWINWKIMMSAENTISKHILPTSATMVGVCMTVISILKISVGSSNSWADEILAIDSLFFIASALLSYVSIRNQLQANKYEEWADRIFIFGLVVMTLACFIVVFTVV